MSREIRREEPQNSPYEDKGSFEKGDIVFITISPPPDEYYQTKKDRMIHNFIETGLKTSIEEGKYRTPYEMIKLLRNRINQLLEYNKDEDTKQIMNHYYGSIEISKTGRPHAHIVFLVENPLYLQCLIGIFKYSLHWNIDFDKKDKIKETILYIQKDFSRHGIDGLKVTLNSQLIKNPIFDLIIKENETKKDNA